MSIAAETAVTSWINGRPGMTGSGNPLVQGAYLQAIRSPADGAYAVVSRGLEPPLLFVAEDSAVSVARIQALVYAGTEEAAESAASELRSAFEALTGCPEPCGDTGVLVLVTDNHNGPAYVQQPQDAGEQYCFQVGADFVLTQ